MIYNCERCKGESADFYYLKEDIKICEHCKDKIIEENIDTYFQENYSFDDLTYDQQGHITEDFEDDNFKEIGE